jgi:hypothetical protein
MFFKTKYIKRQFLQLCEMEEDKNCMMVIAVTRLLLSYPYKGM